MTEKVNILFPLHLKDEQRERARQVSRTLVEREEGSLELLPWAEVVVIWLRPFDLEQAPRLPCGIL